MPEPYAEAESLGFENGYANRRKWRSTPATAHGYNFHTEPDDSLWNAYEYGWSQGNQLRLSEERNARAVYETAHATH